MMPHRVCVCVCVHVQNSLSREKDRRIDPGGWGGLLRLHFSSSAFRGLGSVCSWGLFTSAHGSRPVLGPPALSEAPAPMQVVGGPGQLDMAPQFGRPSEASHGGLLGLGADP